LSIIEKYFFITKKPVYRFSSAQGWPVFNNKSVPTKKSEDVIVASISRRKEFLFPVPSEVVRDSDRTRR
jgi:hypothetical protein